MTIFALEICYDDGAKQSFLAEHAHHSHPVRIGTKDSTSCAINTHYPWKRICLCSSLQVWASFIPISQPSWPTVGQLHLRMWSPFFPFLHQLFLCAKWNRTWIEEQLISKAHNCSPVPWRVLTGFVFMYWLGTSKNPHPDSLDTVKTMI